MALPVCWHYIDIALTLYWHYIDIVLTLHWHCIDIVLSLHWHCIDISCTLHLHYIDTTLTLYWHDIDIALTTHWHRIDIELASPWLLFPYVTSCAGGGRVYVLIHCHVMHGRINSRMIIDPRLPKMPGSSTSVFHRPGRHCLKPREVLGESHEGWAASY